MDHLVYISFGQGRHVDEVRFSVQSAARHLLEGTPSLRRDSWQIDIWTENEFTS